jgi:hypothetical protein
VSASSTFVELPRIPLFTTASGANVHQLPRPDGALGPRKKGMRHDVKANDYFLKKPMFKVVLT